MEPEEKLYSKAETVKVFTYLGDMVSAGLVSEAAIYLGTICG